MHKRVCAAVLSLFILAAADGFAGSRKPEGLGSGQSHETGIMRLITAAEADYYRVQARYATFPELIHSGQIQRTSNQSSDFSRAVQELHLEPDSQPVTGFDLNLMLSSNAGGYVLSLTQTGAKCGLGWFSDQTGMLYGGKALNCVADHSALPGPKNWSPTDIDAVVPPVRNDGSCPLPQILHEASQRATELVENLQRFTAMEQIEHIEFRKNGKPRKSTSELFSYAAEIGPNPYGGFWVDEYRTAKTQADSPPLADMGTAALALIFHPKVIGNFEVHCEGETEWQGTRAWQLRFEEGPDPSKSFSALRIKDSEYQVRFKGRAWIAADDYEVLRLQTDLVAPIPEIHLQIEHFDIAYAPVEFSRRKFRLWLPESASMHISYRGHRYERVHKFSNFQLFLVDTQQKVKDPVAGPSGGK
jgi:hypothetical protein